MILQLFHHLFHYFCKSAGNTPFLHQGGKQAYEALEQSDDKTRVHALRQRVECHGVGFVVEKQLFHAYCHVFAIEESVCLEVVLERAEIDIGGTAGTDAVIAYHELGVEEAARELKDKRKGEH